MSRTDTDSGNGYYDASFHKVWIKCFSRNVTYIELHLIQQQTIFVAHIKGSEVCAF